MYNTDYLSSEIDWCESNFQTNKYIAEFVNSLTSLFITLCGIIGMYYYDQTFILYFSLSIIGITSYYFHATLSEFGQMLDELSIMFCISLSIWFINSYVHRMINKKTLIYLCIFQFISMIIYPILNRLILFTWSIPVLYKFKLYYNLNPKIRKSVEKIVLLFTLSILCWIVDYICVSFLYPMYLHGWWHILIGLTGYYIFKFIDNIMYNLPIYIN
jgi:dihydroceramidase